MVKIRTYEDFQPHKMLKGRDLEWATFQPYSVIMPNGNRKHFSTLQARETFINAVVKAQNETANPISKQLKK